MYIYICIYICVCTYLYNLHGKLFKEVAEEMVRIGAIPMGTCIVCESTKKEIACT